MEEVQTAGVEEPVLQEIAAPETDSQQEVAQEPVQQESRNDRNWRELRRAKEDAERKAKMQDELIERLLASQSKAAPAQQEEDIIEALSKQEYVEGAVAAKSLQQIRNEFKRELDEIKKNYSKSREVNLLNDVKREYADFDDVVNPETLDLLEETNPRLAASLAKTMEIDPYAFAIQSYEYIKSKGLSKNSSSSKRASETEKKIEQNKKTVQSPQVFDKRPMAQAFQMTDSLKKELASEMYRYAQQAGMGY